MKQNKTLRFLSIAIAVFAIGLSWPVSAKRVPINLKGKESSGFNALDHVLQKPLGNDTFPSDQRGFGKNLFLGFGGGISFIGDSYHGHVKPGYRYGVQFGGWFSPVHGFRVGIDLGKASVHDGVLQPRFGAVRADYLVNLTSLLRGYNPERKFELVGALGLEYQRLLRDKLHATDFGMGASLQMRYNATRSLYLYAEPRLAVMGGNRYDGGAGWRRMKADMSLNVGIGYRLLQGSLRQLNTSDQEIVRDEQLYFGVGAGLWGFPRNSFSMRNLFGEAHAGKMFSPTSGLQLSLSFNRYAENKTINTKYVGIASADYVLNLGNAFGGYDPDAVFQTTLNAGVSAGMVTRPAKRVYSPGLSLGLTGLFRITDNWGIFLHPQMYIFNRRFTDALLTRHTPMFALDLGLRYTIGNYIQLRPRDYEEYGKEHRLWFIDAGAGFAHRLRGGFYNGVDAYIGVGKRFTPVSSWRAQFVMDAFPRNSRAIAATLHLDYLSSITTAMYGYDPKRLFDWQMVVGLFGGGAQYDGPVRFTTGFKGGTQFNFRLTDFLDLYVEPQFLAVHAPGVNPTKKWIPELRAQLGLRYKLGTASGQRGRFSDMPVGDGCNFISIAGAPTAFTRTTTDDRIHVRGGFDVAYGRWLSMVSGLRLTYANDWIGHNGGNSYLGSAHVDYLFNLTSLLDRSADRRFHIVGAIGGGLAVSPDANTHLSGMLYGGMQFRYNLPSNIDVHIEPGLQAWPNRLIPEPSSRAHFEIGARLAVGASLRF